MSYREDGDKVVITLSRDDYDRLLMVIGAATVSLKDEAWARGVLRLANRINEGNPNWTPYEVEEPKP